MTLRPGTVAIRTEIALIDRAMSSARPITRLVLVPGAGSSSYKVTTGPGLTFSISPWTPKSSSTPSRRRAFCCNDSLLIAGFTVRDEAGSSSRSSGGN